MDQARETALGQALDFHWERPWLLGDAEPKKVEPADVVRTAQVFYEFLISKNS